jgi:hypothetical protein
LDSVFLGAAVVERVVAGFLGDGCSDGVLADCFFTDLEGLVGDFTDVFLCDVGAGAGFDCGPPFLFCCLDARFCGDPVSALIPGLEFC